MSQIGRVPRKSGASARLRPFGPIALSLSGGGYRAAAFHLGTLDLLHRLGLLRDVTVLSTVSGGTLTGCSYALARARGRRFGEFFRDFYAFLGEANVLARAVERLRTGTPRTLSGRHTLSVAAADVYRDPRFVGDATFGQLLDARLHLREMTFNATDLRTGVAFRFQVSRSGGRIGNRYASMPKAAARHLRLADVVAASSCFPGAFEPLSFPEDFAWPAVALDARGRPSGVPVTELPLMDGGIYDNQGIQGLLLAVSRLRKRGREPHLFIVSDTRPRQTALFAFPAAGPPGRLTIAEAIRVGKVLVAACAVSAVALGLRLESASREGRLAWPLDAFTTILPFALTATLAIGIPFFWSWARREASRRFPGEAASLWKTLAHLRLRALAELVDLRLRSLIALTADVFLERIRSLSYKRLYEHPQHNGRIVSNLVYALETADVPAAWLAPSSAQQEVARRAAATPTALWFDRPEQLRDVVACGQSTICYGLLAYLLERHGTNPGAYPPEVEAVFERARSHWIRLRANPEVLLEERLSGLDTT